MEICGQRHVSLNDPIIPKFRPSELVHAIRLITPSKFTLVLVEDVQIRWFQHEEYVDYEAANKSTYYGEIDFSIKNVTEDKYSDCFTNFRKNAIHPLCRNLGFSSWGIGKGIIHRRGQDLFIIELDGFEDPMWNLHWTIKKSHTYGQCLQTAEVVDLFAQEELPNLLSLR